MKGKFQETQHTPLYISGIPAHKFQEFGQDWMSLISLSQDLGYFILLSSIVFHHIQYYAFEFS